MKGGDKIMTLLDDYNGSIPESRQCPCHCLCNCQCLCQCNPTDSTIVQGNNRRADRNNMLAFETGWEDVFIFTEWPKP